MEESYFFRDSESSSSEPRNIVQELKSRFEGQCEVTDTTDPLDCRIGASNVSSDYRFRFGNSIDLEISETSRKDFSPELGIHYRTQSASARLSYFSEGNTSFLDEIRKGLLEVGFEREE